MLQSYFIGCSLANRDTRDRSITVFHQRNPKPVFNYSLRQQSNSSITLSRALSQRYVADFEHVRT